MTERDLQAEDDMRVLAQADEVEKNPARKAAAVTRARDRAAELSAFADKNQAKEKPFNGSTGLGLSDMQKRKGQ
jgi:hypothetical protein